MYAKIFASLFDSTLNEAPLHIFKTWIGMLTFADCDGILDMTPRALSNRVALPLDLVEQALEFLSSPDAKSRSQVEQGRRIIGIPGRAYGWIIVNHKHYRDLHSSHDRRDYMRKYMQEYRSGDKSQQRSAAKSRKRKRADRDDSPSASPELQAIGDAYNRLATKFGKPAITPRGLATIAPAIERCEAALRADDPAFNFAEMLQRAELQPFFGNGWPWALAWFTRSGEDFHNARATWGREYSDGNVRALPDARTRMQRTAVRRIPPDGSAS